MDGNTIDGSSTVQPDLSEALQRAIRRGPTVIDAHLRTLQRDILIGETRTTAHCYCLPVDGNGRVRVNPLADFLYERIVDYSIPRRTVEEATRQLQETGSTAGLMKLQARARGLFTHLAKSGEGGELLLFAMAEAVFGLAQILCKMTLKTSPHVHYHGADGVYADVRTDGGLNVYWAESKIFGDPVAAIRECLNSLAPFLVEPDGTHAKREQDILLINEFANFSNADLVIGLKQFFDRDTPASLQLQHRGFALVGFDSLAYGTDGVEQTMDAIEAALKIELPSWQNNIATDPAP